MIRNAERLEFQAIFPVEPPSFSPSPSPRFALGICCEEAVSEPHVTSLVFLPPQVGKPPETRFARKVVTALEVWLRNPRYSFDLPVVLKGTEFQRRVWAKIAAIPCGETLSYAEIAQRLDSSPRAVGGACGANPIPILIPCHRVIAKNGGLTGFAHARTGWMPEIKRWLLAREGVKIRETRHA
ncbi:MAG: methylated-DNA--[protein]-cysteine S-methyltransferase [Zoogloeaceae bacterium]|jgi:methylated-DNA-[protein]-cysteine S-methyltransferase|nr:methylated-DNA--[protein]-cysteine S-methyltransferase [Zoogloeaceae bacterium]